MTNKGKFPPVLYDEWAQTIINGLGLKKKSGEEYGKAPCPHCGGDDRFFIWRKDDGEIGLTCRKNDCSIGDMADALRNLGYWPQQVGDTPMTVEDDLSDFDIVAAYHERKGIDLFCAKQVGEDVVVPIYKLIDGKLKRTSKQTITAEGEKKFEWGGDIEAAFTPLGELRGTVYLAEGFATAASCQMATGKTAIFCLNSGNLPKVAALLQDLKPDCKFIVAADNDAAGIKAAEQTGLTYVLPQQEGTDFNDLHATEGLEAVKHQLTPISPLNELVMIDDAQPMLTANYLVKGWLGKEQLAVVYGPSNVGKSFFMLDMAYHIAAGRMWHGEYRVRGGGVLYLATEGGNAFRSRAWAVANKYREEGQAPIPLAIRPSQVNLLDPEADLPHLKRLVTAFKEEYGELSLIVVDTLSRAMAGGNENGPEDMTVFIQNVDELREFAGAGVAIVHHSGKDSAAGARGHSSLRAATDTEIELSVSKSGKFKCAKATKQRDMETGNELPFQLEIVELGKDEDGDEVTTCTMRMLSESEIEELSVQPLSGDAKAVADAFWRLKGERVGGENPKGAGWPDKTIYWCIEMDTVKDHYMGGHQSDNENTKRSGWNRGKKALVAKGYAHINEKMLCLRLDKEGVA